MFDYLAIILAATSCRYFSEYLLIRDRSLIWGLLAIDWHWSYFLTFQRHSWPEKKADYCSEFQRKNTVPLSRHFLMFFVYVMD